MKRTHYLEESGTLDQISYTLCGIGFNVDHTTADPNKITCAACRKLYDEGYRKNPRPYTILGL